MISETLANAFRILENEYVRINTDGEDLNFNELARALRNKLFEKTDELKALFIKVDRYNTGTLGFPEYLALMYYFSEVARYDQVFSKTEAEAIDNAFKLLETSFIKYDADKSRSLSRDELKKFVDENLDLKVLKFSEFDLAQLCDGVFPKGSDKLTFKRFLVLLYTLILPDGRFTEASTKSKARERKPKEVGTRVSAGGSSSSASLAGVTGEVGKVQSTELFILLEHAFAVLEQDFGRFDVDNNNVISLAELSEALSTKNSAQLVSVISQLEHLFKKVDLDDSGGIDFCEFLYFVYLLVENGSYKEVINDAVDAGAVKRAFIFLRKSYTLYDADGNQRLDHDEVSRFLTEYFGAIPQNFEKVFGRIKNPKKGNIDFVRFLQLLYELVRVKGKYVGREIDPSSRARVQQSDFKTPAPDGSVGTRPPRMEKVKLKEIVKDKEVGSGGFSTVFKATLRNHVVAAKYIKGDYSEEVFEEFKIEVDFMKRLDHPHLCFLVASVAEEEKLVIVTEFCENGTLFDLLHKKRQRLARSDVHRLALEIAVGMEALHKLDPPIIHRDLKSLNILLDAQYRAKVADFGLSKTAAKNLQHHTAGVGTPQWTAPEVLQSPNYGISADVFSYGVVLWEMTHNSIPYAGLDAIQIALQVVKGARPPLKPSCPKELGDLMTECWHHDPSKRPTFTTIVDKLNKCKKDYQ